MEHKYHPGMEVHANVVQRFLFGTSWRTKAIIQDIKYAAKMLCGIASGFDGLQANFGGDWEYVEYSKVESRDHTGAYKAKIDYDLVDKPYYVCVTWKNRTHAPLPILIDAESEGSIQNKVVEFMFWLWNHAFCPESFRAAVMACREYGDQYAS